MKYGVTCALVLAVLMTALPALAEGDDIYNPARQYSDEIYSPDYARNRAQQNAARDKALRDQAKAAQDAAASARAAEAKTLQQDIDARVKDATSATSDYGTRIDSLKAPAPQLPADGQAQPATTGATTPPAAASGVAKPAPAAGTGSGSQQGGSVLERMMDSLK